jgi:pimeloyl-ACP methyl ester carboxylesterase
VCALLEYEDLGGVVLVGHSYGGMVVAGVAGRMPQRLAHVVYLDAYVPEDGQSMIDLVPPERLESMLARVHDEGDGWRLPSFAPESWDVTVRERYLVTDAAEVRWLVERLRPQPFKTMTEPLRVENPAAAAAIPRTYIRCPLYPNAKFDEHARSFREQGLPSFELPTSHDAMVTAPRQLADILLALS